MPTRTRAKEADPVTLFVCGDVMTGRGIDQVLPKPGDPRIYERFAKSALEYVQLAERENGPIPKPVDYRYIWGDALAELERRAPDVRIINLETGITKSDKPAPKGINYKMSPENTPCLSAARIDCCVLANNHILDWGEAGCLETIETLHRAHIETAGVGGDSAAASTPAVLELERGSRVLVFAFGSVSSGIPPSWAAGPGKPGVNLLRDFSEQTVNRIARELKAFRRSGDLVVASIHWGSNWGYRIPAEQRSFAHGLIDRAEVDLVHGHSSHHPKGIELYRGRPILYGCGDLITDYEGIRGYEEYRGELTMMYFVSFDPSTRELLRVQMTPLELKRFRLNRASGKDARWLRDLLAREGRALGTTAERLKDDTLLLRSL